MHIFSSFDPPKKEIFSFSFVIINKKKIYKIYNFIYFQRPVDPVTTHKLLRVGHWPISWSSRPHHSVLAEGFQSISLNACDVICPSAGLKFQLSKRTETQSGVKTVHVIDPYSRNPKTESKTSTRLGRL